MLNSISRLRETRPEQEWSNVTEFSGNSDFPRYTQTFGIKFRKMSVPFAPLPKFLVKWKVPMRLPVRDFIRSHNRGFLTETLSASFYDTGQFCYF